MRTIALILFEAVASAQQSPDFVGRWRSVETSKGGIGAMYDFNADGTANFSPGAIVRMQYRLDGDRLVTTPADGPPMKVSWNGANQLRLGIGGNSESYTRLGLQPDSANPLIGEWTGSRNMDGQTVVVHWTFGADRSAVMMIRFLSAPGRYQFAGGRLVATFGNRGALNGPIELANGILTIHRRSGSAIKLQRY
jgi:hypothetical protein